MRRKTISALALLALSAAGFALAGRAPASTTRAGTDIKPYTAPTVTAVTSHTVTAGTSKGVTAVTSHTVTAVTSHTVTAVTSHTVTAVTSKTVKPHTSKTITVNKPALPPKPLAFYFRTWRLGVPGGSYVTPGAIGSGTGTPHVSLGTAASHRLTIRADHTWTWGSSTGQWRNTGRRDYPIVLVNAYEGDNWDVGYDDHNDGRIYAWNRHADWWLYGKP